MDRPIILAIALSLYLLLALSFRLRVRCAICMRGHLTNLTLLALLLRMWLRRRSGPAGTSCRR